MGRYWTYYWKFEFWNPDVNSEGAPVRSAAGNSFRKRGVSPGDTAYVISNGAGQLYLGGRMVVKKIVSRAERFRIWQTDNLYDAEEWLVDPDETGTLLHLHRRLSPELTKRLRLLTRSGPKNPFFKSDSKLDVQAVRGLRELAPESAAFLDEIIEATDRLPNTGELVTVTDELLEQLRGGAERLEFRLPDEVPPGSTYSEGNVRRVAVNRYERDRDARTACIATHGSVCCVPGCGFDFGKVYGPEADGYIHVHHLRPLAEVGEEYEVDPVDDLRPVCPNCHAVLHLGGENRTIEEVSLLLARVKDV